MSIKKISEEWKKLTNERWTINSRCKQYDISSGYNCELSLLDIIQEHRRNIRNINLQELNNRIDELEACVKFSNKILYNFDLKNNTVILGGNHGGGSEYDYFIEYADFITAVMADENIKVDFDYNTKEITAIFGPEYMR